VANWLCNVRKGLLFSPLVPAVIRLIRALRYFSTSSTKGRKRAGALIRELSEFYSLRRIDAFDTDPNSRFPTANNFYAVSDKLPRAIERICTIYISCAL